MQHCIEQCFVGSLVRLSFQSLHTSKADTASPINITTCAYMQHLPEQELKISKANLVAGHISRTDSFDGRTTVFDLLKDTLKLFRKPVTPCNLSVFQEGHDSQGSTLYDTRLSLSRQAEYSFASPLVLSCETPCSSKLHLKALSLSKTTQHIGFDKRC